MSSQGSASRETRDMLEHEIHDLPLPLSVVIGKSTLTIRDLLQLQRGDVLCLDKHKDSDLVVQIGNKNKLSGKAGLIGRKKAVKITGVIQAEVPGCHE